MCGLVGAISKQDTFCEDDIALIRNLMRESQIRGRHATGYAHNLNGRIVGVVENIPAVLFLEKHISNELLFSNLFIGHCRYSTSSLETSQPIFNEHLAIAHNGVVTQESPDKWERHFNVQCSTENDSEIVFHKLMNGYNPFEDIPSASGALLYIKPKSFVAYRNGKRPLWMFYTNTAIFFASTQDIIARATKRMEGCSHGTLIKPGIEYEYNEHTQYFGPGEVIEVNTEDWQ